MNNKEYKKIYVSDLLALVHILDSYEEFNGRLKKFVSKKYNRDDIYNLYKVSTGKFCLSPRVRKFYKENKNIIDIINTYSTISAFVNYIYDSSGKYASWCDIEFFYKYLNDNREQLDKIVNLLEKIQQLGFWNIKFNEEEDFKDKEYEINKKYIFMWDIITDIKFLENIELIAEYKNNILKYKTTGSNYCMVLPYRDDAKNWAAKEIILNNLLFDVKCLPKSLKKEDTINKILALQETRKKENIKITKQERLSINDLVELGVKIFDFEKGYANLKYTVDRLETVKSKEELKRILSNMKLELEKLKQINSNEVKENPNVTEEQIQAEKQLYIKRREFQYLDLD